MDSVESSQVLNYLPCIRAEVTLIQPKKAVYSLLSSFGSTVISTPMRTYFSPK